MVDMQDIFRIAKRFEPSIADIKIIPPPSLSLPFLGRFPHGARKV